MDLLGPEALFRDTFTDLLSSRTVRRSLLLSSYPTVHKEGGLEVFHATLEQIYKLIWQLEPIVQEEMQLQRLINLVDLLKNSSSLLLAQKYECIQSLRAWIFWMPIELLQAFPASAVTLAVTAHVYTVGFLAARLLPETGAAYLASLSLPPTEQITRRMISIGTAHEVGGGVLRETPLSLMAFPINAVAQFRWHLEYLRPEQHRSFSIIESYTDGIEDAELPPETTASGGCVFQLSSLNVAPIPVSLQHILEATMRNTPYSY